MIIAEDHLYSGTVNQSSVRICELFRKPLIRNAAGIILVHNHPSGDPNPSAADIIMTRSAIEAGKTLEIRVLDHVIIGQGKWISVKEFLD